LEIQGWIKNLISSIEDNGSLIVIKTYTGSAETVSRLIDERKVEGILGTVGGDDSILIIPNSDVDIKKLKEDLKILLS